MNLNLDKDKNRKIVLKIVEKFQVPIIGMLIEREVLELINDYKELENDGSPIIKMTNRWENVKLTEKNLNNFAIYNTDIDLNTGSNVVEKDWVVKFRDLFPKGKKGNVSTIWPKAIDFFLRNKQYSQDFIYNLVSDYIHNMESTGNTKYVFSANNIFKKNEGSIIKYPIMGIIEKYNSDEINNLEFQIDSDLEF